MFLSISRMSGPSLALVVIVLLLNVSALAQEPSRSDLQLELGPGESNWTPPPAPTALSTVSLADGLTLQQLIDALVGDDVTVSNITYTGANIAAGTFSGGSGIIGFEDGIVLSSGNIASVAGPNTAETPQQTTANPVTRTLIP